MKVADPALLFTFYFYCDNICYKYVVAMVCSKLVSPYTVQSWHGKVMILKGLDNIDPDSLSLHSFAFSFSYFEMVSR